MKPYVIKHPRFIKRVQAAKTQIVVTASAKLKAVSMRITAKFFLWLQNKPSFILLLKTNRFRNINTHNSKKVSIYVR